MTSKQNETTTESQEATRPGLKMQDLVNATGAPKGTILHYLREGLLPEPVKTSTNMAYYDQLSVARIRLIRQLQHNHRLKLSEIRRILADSVDEEELSMRASLNELVFGPLQTEGDLDARILRSNRLKPRAGIAILAREAASARTGGPI